MQPSRHLLAAAPYHSICSWHMMALAHWAENWKQWFF